MRRGIGGSPATARPSPTWNRHGTQAGAAFDAIGSADCKSSPAGSRCCSTYPRKLRATKADERLLVLHTNMEAGHGGAAGRFDRLKETALVYAFVLHVFGMGTDAA